MKLMVSLQRRLRWLNLPTMSLLALLQRTPIARVAAVADEFVLSSPFGSVLKSTAALAASLGAVHSMAGATDLVASTPSPASVTVGAAVSISFGISGTLSDPENWVVGGNFPPGLSFSGTTSGTVSGGSIILNGTPTTAGSYTITLRAHDDVGGDSQTYNYQINVSGAATSAPSFTTQPQSQTVTTGANVTFTAAASGTPTPTYQWKKGSQDIAGATTATLMLNNVTTTDSATYTVVATNSAGTATSNGAVLTVNPPASSAPTITTNPTYQTVAVGGSATFSVTASGTAPLTYQWRKDTTAINGATNSIFTIAAVTTNDAGSYNVVVTNSSGTATSTSAALTVLLASGSPASRLINLSVLRDGGDGVTMGFVIRGSGSKKMVLRGVGPGLANVGVPLNSCLPDPKLDLYEKSTLLDSNDNWGGTQALRDAFSSVGAFGLDDNSKDAAVSRSLTGDDYSAKITGAPGTSGLTIVEAYDADGAGGSIRLVNLSALANVNKDKPLTAGFVIRDGPKTVLLRAVGPGLATVGVTSGYLADPKLTLYAGPNEIKNNDDWGGAAQLKSAFSAVGAFGLASDTSKDAVILVTLNPGDYSVSITATGSDSGLAIVEIYEVQ